MKERKVQVLVEIYFKPNEDLEKRIRAAVKRPLRFCGSGQLLGPSPERDLEYVATVPMAQVAGLCATAYRLRRLRGVKSVSFSIVEEIPLTKGPQ